MLNNRELATVILVALFSLLALAVPKWRNKLLPSVGIVARSFFQWTILRIFGLFIVWVALWVWLASLIGAWELSLVKDTIIILFGVGFPSCSDRYEPNPASRSSGTFAARHWRCPRSSCST